MDGRFDEMLLGLAQKHKGIEDFWYTLMNFYERNTDLFHVKDSLEDKKGFKAGEAEDMVRKQFNHFQARYLERAQPHLLMRRGKDGKPIIPALPASASSSSSSADAAAGGAPRALPMDRLRAAPMEAIADEVAAAEAASVGRMAPSSGPGSKEIPMGVNASPLEGGDPGQWEKEVKKVASDNDRCRWNQSPQEVNVELSVNKCTKQDIKVVFSAKKISVKCKGELILDGPLHDKINCEESTWHLEDSKRIVLSLEKIRQTYWERLVEEGATVIGQ